MQVSPGYHYQAKIHYGAFAALLTPTAVGVFVDHDGWVSRFLKLQCALAEWRILSEVNLSVFTQFKFYTSFVKLEDAEGPCWRHNIFVVFLNELINRLL